MNPLARRIQGPVAVIGDVHGQIDQLVIVLERLTQLPDYEDLWLLFIGDLIDRGRDPKAALDIFCDLLLEHPRTTMVCGNHELAMAGALGLIPTPDYSNWAERWIRDYQSEATFSSFGVEHGDLDGLRSSLSSRHVELLSDLPWCVEHPQYFFVHAGLDPNTPFEMQTRILRQRDFTLNRPPWLCSKSFVTARLPDDCPLTVVSGHVQVPAVTIEPRRILCDTTGGTGGDLSCVLLPDNRVITSGSSPEPQAVKSRAHSDRQWWKFW
ncbi:MAG: metallophosphoesterase [Planctomycetaceae bacterium]